MAEAAIKIQEPEFARIPLAQLQFDPRNARKFEANMDFERSAKFQELVNSIREKDVIEPILVRVLAEGYMIIAGERRVRACQYIEKHDKRSNMTVPAMVHDCDEETAYDMGLIENLQREDLTALEMATVFKEFVDNRDDKPAAVAELALRTGLAEQKIQRLINVANMPQVVQDKWSNGDITYEHVKLLARISSEEQMLAALTLCLQNNWSAKAFKDVIEKRSPDISTARFDTQACQACAFNSMQQGSLLLVESDSKGKCSNPSCFEEKQGAFFTENWAKTKGAEVLQTSGFVFEHRLDINKIQVINRPHTESLEDRCQTCPQCLSVVDLSADIVAGKERICTGAAKCYEELYLAPVRKKTEEKLAEKPEKTGKKRKKTNTVDSAGPATKADDAQSSSQKEKAQQEKRTRRSSQFREKSLRQLLPSHLDQFAADNDLMIGLVIALLKSAYSSCFDARPNSKTDSLCAVRNADIESPIQELKSVVRVIVEKHHGYVTDDLPFLDEVAHMFGFSYEKAYSLDQEHVKLMTISDIVAMGEESSMALWNDEKVLAYREEHHPKKGWASLKKSDLMKCIFSSGADLNGRVPSELLLTRKDRK